MGMAVTFGKDALSEEKINDLMSHIEESQKTFKWASNYTLWQPTLVVPNGAVLTYILPEAMANEIFAELVARRKLPYLPQNRTMMFYKWLPGSAITWHSDYTDKNSMTIYLSRDWKPDYGGYFCWRDWDEVFRRHDYGAPPIESRMRMPVFNQYVYMTDAEWHTTTITAANAPPRLSLQMFFEKEVEAHSREKNEMVRRERSPLDAPHENFAQIESFLVRVDDKKYTPEIQDAIVRGYYEQRERDLLRYILRPGDRVLELGSGIGVIAMTAAAIVGETNVMTFDANPNILIEAKDNFHRNGFSNIQVRVGLLKNQASFKRGEFADFYIDAAFWGSRLDASAETPGIVEAIKSPIYCFEDEVAFHKANVLLCDIEGDEIELFEHADLSGLRTIVVETHPWIVSKEATARMISKIANQGFKIHAGAEGDSSVVLLER
jgi:predicted RNA methylase